MCRDKNHGGRRCGTTKSQSLARKVRRTKALLAQADPESERARVLTDRLLKAQSELNEVRLEEARLRNQEETAPRFAYTMPDAPNTPVGNDSFQDLLEAAVDPADPSLDWDVIEGILSQMSDGYKDKSREEMLSMLLESGFYSQEHWGDITTLAPVSTVIKQRVVNKTLSNMEHISTSDLLADRPDLRERLARGDDEQEMRRLAVSGLVGRWADNYSRSADGAFTGDLDHFQAAADTLAYRGPEGLSDAVSAAQTPQERVAGAFILAQYNQTQELFAAKGITHLRLYRGMSWGAQYEETIFDNIPEWAHPSEGEFSHQHEVPLSGLSSFTTSKPTAEFFAQHTTGGRESGLGTVISATVPVSRVISTPLSGMGCFAEREVIIMGGEGNWHVESNYGDPLAWEEFIERNAEAETETETEVA